MKQKKLSSTYIIALSIIAVLVIISAFVVNNGISKLMEDAKFINLAGRQRMLSQKMTKASLAMQQSTDAATFNASKKELREALELFTKSHNALQLGNEVMEIPEPHLSEQSTVLFKEIKPSFESLQAAESNIAKLNFSGDADANASAFQQNIPIIHQNEGVFLKIINNIVTQFEKEYKDKISTLNIIVYIVSGAILITLFLLAILFFQPLVVGIQKFIIDIEASNNKLKESETEILKSTEKALEANEKMFFAQKDLQKTQATLKQSETLFRGVVENAPLVIFSLDKQGTFMLSEGQGLEDLGLKSGQVVGMNAFDLYKDSPSVVADLEAVLNGGIPVESISQTNGEYFENRFTPLKDQFGNVTGMVGISSNVTDRQKFQEQLQTAEEETRKSLIQQQTSNKKLIIAQEKILESEDSMRKALENSLEATENAYLLQKEVEKAAKKMKEAFVIAKSGAWEFEMNLDGTNGVLTLTDEYYALFGTTADKEGGYKMKFEDWVGKFVHPDDIHILTESSVGALQNPEFKYLSEHRALKADKTIFEYSTEVQTKLYPAEGKVRGQGIASDITERKQAQREIESSAAFQKGILESAGFGIIATDINGIIVSFNAAAEKLTGYSRAELEGKESPAILHVIDEIVARTMELNKQYNEEMTPGFGAFIYEANKNIVRPVEFMYVRKDKTTFPVYLTTSAIRDKEGNVTAYLGMVEDITEKKAVEIDAKKRQERLIRQNNVISELSAVNFSETTLQKSYEVITRLAAVGLGVERVSIWDYKTDKIISRKLFQKTENSFTAGVELFAKDFPKYFEELKTELIIAADNANTDSTTAEFSEDYLKPLGIGAMLDIPIRMEGKMVGVLRNEHVGDARVWEADEISFAKSVADIIALAFEANKRQLIQKDLEEYSKELKQMFSVVQENEVKLDNALRLAKIGEFEFDLQNMTMSWSESFWETVLETPKQENIGFEEFNKRFTYPEDIEKSNAQLGVVMQSTDPNFSNKFELRIVDTKGNIKTTEVTAKAPVRNSEGLPISLNGTIQDITERKAAEQLVNRLSLVASKTENAVIISNGAGLIEWVNEGFTTVTEYTLEEVIGKKPGTFLQGEKTDQAQVQLFRENLLTKKSFYQELYNYSKSGRGYWLGINITPILNENGEIMQFIAIESDITERKEIDAVIEQKNKELVANEARLTSAMKELRVVQNQMIASAKNDKVLALKRGITEEEFEKARNIDQYKDIDFSYIDDLKAKNLPVADNEADRLKALYDYDLLDTEAEEDLDGLTKLAAFVCGTPISLISLIDKDRQWFKSDYGLGAEETARDIAFCHHAIMDTKVFEVEDAMADKRFMDNPLVQGSPDIRFYAGAPLTTPDGFNIGTLCVIDKKTAKLSQEQKNALEVIASEVMARLESRRQNKIVLAINNKALAAFEELEKAQDEIKANETRLTGALKELRVVQNQMIASAKNDKILALKRGITEEEFDRSRDTNQYKDLDFAYIQGLKDRDVPVPTNEEERIKALYDYDILDTEAEEDLDGLTKLAAFVCGTNISIINLIDKERFWVKSDNGLGAKEALRDLAFCNYALMDTKVFEIEDTTKDERFMNSPLVTGSPDLRFYAGAPLTTPDGYNIGTLCVLDKKAQKLTQQQIDALNVIATEVMARLESRRQNKIVLAINNKALAAFEELEKAQVEIDANEKRFTNIAANTPDLIYQFFVSTEGRASFPYTSPAIEAIFELKPEDVKDDAMPLIALVAPEDRIRFQETVAISAEKMETFTYEGKFLTKSGKTKWIRAQAKPEMQDNGIMYNGTIVDITELKNAEEDVNNALEMQKIINDSMIIAQRELAKKNDQLGKSEEEMRQIMERQLEANEQLMMAEKKIKSALDSELAGKEELERTYGTLKDAQSQLVHSEKMASLGQLTAGIAHEINNPINFVYNGIDTLKMSLDELLEIVEKYAELDKAEDKEKVLKEVQALKRQLSYGDLLGDINSLVGDIKKGAVRTMEIVKGLRVFSRLDEEEKKFANISECLDATLILLQNKFKGRVEVKKYYDASMKEINCYPGQLNQVFMNIINNAIQSISEDRKDGLITIYTETQEQNVVIRIKDNGVGMSEQVKKRVFEPFFTTKAVGVGTGLGMSITFGIIEKHNGQIFVNSEEGKGTEFVIQIPKDLQ